MRCKNITENLSTLRHRHSFGDKGVMGLVSVESIHKNCFSELQTTHLNEVILVFWKQRLSI